MPESLSLHLFVGWKCDSRKLPLCRLQVYDGGIISEKNLFGCPFLKLPRLANLSQSPQQLPSVPQKKPLCSAGLLLCSV